MIDISLLFPLLASLIVPGITALVVWQKTATKGQLSALQQTVSLYEQRVQGLKDKIKDLEEENVEQSTHIQKLEAKVETIGHDVETCEARVLELLMENRELRRKTP